MRRREESLKHRRSNLECERDWWSKIRRGNVRDINRRGTGGWREAKDERKEMPGKCGEEEKQQRETRN